MHLIAVEPGKWRKLSITLYLYGAGWAVFAANTKDRASTASCRADWVVQEFQLPSCRTRARLAVIKDRGTWKRIHVYDFLWRHNTLYEQWAYICLRMLVGDIRFFFLNSPLQAPKRSCPRREIMAFQIQLQLNYLMKTCAAIWPKQPSGYKDHPRQNNVSILDEREPCK